MIFVNGYSTWGIFELKTHFGTWISRNDVNGVSFFHLSYLITLMAYLCSQRTPNKYFVFHWENYISLAKYGLENWFYPNDDVRKCLLDMKHGWTENAF
jgi:hypothetical protein